MLPLVPGLFWSLNSQLAACENKGQSIVTHCGHIFLPGVTLLPLSQWRWGTAVRERQRGSWESSDNQNTKRRVSAAAAIQYMTGSDLDIEVVRLHTHWSSGATPPNYQPWDSNNGIFICSSPELFIFASSTSQDSKTRTLKKISIQ